MHSEPEEVRFAMRHSSFVAESPDGNICLVFSVRLNPLDSNGRAAQVVLLRTMDHGQSWSALPYKLSLLSRGITGLGAVWPPEVALEVGWQDSLFFIFRDYAAPQGGTRFSESLWRATFSESKAHWCLRRVRRIDSLANDWKVPNEIKWLEIPLFRQICQGLLPRTVDPLHSSTEYPPWSS